MIRFRPRGHNQIEETRRTRAREDLAKVIRKELRSNQSRPQGLRPFVSARTIGLSWTLERIRDLLEGLGWSVDEHLEIISLHFLKILSILVWIEWDNWQDFHSTFLDYRNASGTYLRCDYQLPFTDLSFLRGDDQCRQSFSDDQYLFKPVVIREDVHMIYDDRWPLPFMDTKEIGHGSFGAVTKELVEAKYLWWKKGGVNDQRLWVARKVLNNQNIAAQSFEKERENLEKFKSCLAKSENIMLSFSTFVHGSQFNIISDLADLDLLKLLTGDYMSSDLRRRAEKFTPRNLFKEAACLANALEFLHKGLTLPDGPVSCAHTDLKPDNILVMWPVRDEELLARNPKSTNEDLPVGRWLIHDFGISVIRETQSERGDRGRSDPNRQLAPLEAALDGSKFTAPRDAGPYQPPEVKGTKTKVTKECDLWSFGCILTMILAFALGGPTLVQELNEIRLENYNDNYFYGDNGVKREIQDWLASLETRFSQQQYWISDFRNIIGQLLILDPKARLDAGSTFNRLLEICKKIRGTSAGPEKRLWLLPGQGANRPARPANLDISTARTMIPNGRHLTANLPTPERATPKELKSPIATRSIAPSINSSQEKGSTNHSQPSYDFQPAPSTFAKLELPRKGASHTTLSPCGRRAAFWNKSVVYVYQLEVLDEQNRWKPSDPKTVEKDQVQQFFVEFEADDHQIWTGVYLAGPFIALAFKSRTGQDYTAFKVYEFSNLSIASTVDPGPRYVVPGQDGYGAVKLSSRGVLLLQFNSFFRLFLRSQHTEISLKGSLQAVSFSKGGDWICAWYYEKTNQLWTIWDNTTTVYSHGEVPLDPWHLQSGTANELLLSFSDTPEFVACDENGRIRFISGIPSKSAQIILLKETMNHVLFGAVADTDDAIVLVRNPPAVHTYSRIDAIVIGQRNGQVVRESKPLGRLKNVLNDKTGGVAIRESATGTFVITCRSDGLLERKMIRPFD